MPLRKGRIDEDTAAEDAKWDGLRGIVAWGLRRGLPARTGGAASQAEGERSLIPDQKARSEIRPIFHWKERSVRARIATRCMAFSCAGICASDWTGLDAG